jgi:hypothetical protein
MTPPPRTAAVVWMEPEVVQCKGAPAPPHRHTASPASPKGERSRAAPALARVYLRPDVLFQRIDRCRLVTYLNMGSDGKAIHPPQGVTDRLARLGCGLRVSFRYGRSARSTPAPPDVAEGA